MPLSFKQHFENVFFTSAKNDEEINNTNCDTDHMSKDRSICLPNNPHDTNQLVIIDENISSIMEKGNDIESTEKEIISTSSNADSLPSLTHPMEKKNFT